jgi:hypothetical protein
MTGDCTEQPALIPLCALCGAQLLAYGRLLVHACPDGRVVLFLETGKKGGVGLELMPADVAWLADVLKLVRKDLQVSEDHEPWRLNTSSTVRREHHLPGCADAGRGSGQASA